jgi:hypothetical protein
MHQQCVFMGWFWWPWDDSHNANMPVVKHKPIASIFPLSKYLKRHGWEHNLWHIAIAQAPPSAKKLRTCHTSFHGHSFRPLTCGNVYLPQVVGKTLAMFSTYFKILPVDSSTGLCFLQSLSYMIVFPFVFTHCYTHQNTTSLYFAF